MQGTASYVVYILIFACAFFGMQTVIGAGRQAATRVKLANARLKRLETHDSHIDVIASMRKSRSLNAEGELEVVVKWINTLVLQSGVSLGKYGFFYIQGALLAILPLIAWVVFGTFYHLGGAVLIAVLGPIQVLRFFVKRRRNKIGSQLPEALDVIIRSLGAGHPVPVAMSLVGQEMPDPIGSEFGIASDEISFGTSLGGAIQRMADRIGHVDFDLFAANIRLQERTGGNLAELLRANSKTIRDRQRMRLKIKAASAEGRMSAMILNITPFALFFMVQLISPEFYGDIEGDPILKYGFGFAAIWMLIGNLVMRKMIAFKI